MSPLLTHWRRTLSLTLPVAFSGLAELILGIVDAAFIGHLGVTSLAAIGVALPIYTLLIQIIAATTLGYQILAARRFGAKNPAGVAVALSHSLLLVMPIVLFSFAVAWFAQPLVSLMASSPQVAAEAMTYLHYRSPALFFFAAALLLKYTLDAKGQTYWGMYSAIVANILNVVLSYLLIFGISFFPALGIAGSAIGSTTASLSSVLIFVAIWLRQRPLVRPPLAFQRSEIEHLFRLSWPELLNTAIDYLGNLVFVAIIGLLGITALATGRIASLLIMILFTFAMSFGIATQIMMGQSYGAQNALEARQILHGNRLLSLIVLTVIGGGLVIWPQFVLRIFTPSADLIATAQSTIVVVGATAPLMAWTMCLVGALRSVGRTLQIMYVNVAAVWLVQIPLGWFLGVILGFGLPGVFAGYIGYFLVRTLVYQAMSIRYVAKREQVLQQVSEQVV